MAPVLWDMPLPAGYDAWAAGPDPTNTSHRVFLLFHPALREAEDDCPLLPLRPRNGPTARRGETKRAADWLSVSRTRAV